MLLNIKKICLFAGIITIINGFAEDITNLDELSEMSFEQLMNVEITSLAGKSEPLSKTPAAVYVLSSKDIKRSGATSVPEALRYVPGVQVARLDSSKWAISIRGHNDRFSNKLLIMVDGRTIYNPFYNGAYWNDQNLILDDIQRIEIIRGSGGSSWGTAAVNGIINIITKNTKDIQGGLINLRTGTEEKAMTAFRYGGQLDDQTHYKVWGKYSDNDKFYDDLEKGNKAHDDWNIASGGFKLDYSPTASDTFSLDFEIFEEQIHEKVIRSWWNGGTVPKPAAPANDLLDTQQNVRGGHALFNWGHAFSETEEFALQFFADRYENSTAALTQRGDTYNFDLEYSFEALKNHQITFGAGYKYFDYHIIGSKYATLNKNLDEDIDSKSLFIQDDITVIEDLLKLTLGCKFEKNEMTGWENQPSARITLTPTKDTTIWGAVSRSVRVPSVMGQLGNLMFVEGRGGAPFDIRLNVNGKTESEIANLYELGIRQQFNDNLSIELTGFVNDYQNIRTIINTPSPTDFNLDLSYDMEGITTGAELAVSYQATDWWKIRTGYSYVYSNFNNKVNNLEHFAPGSDAKSIEERDAKHQAFLQSFVDISDKVTFDTTYRYVSAVAVQPNYNNIPAYFTMDARIGLEFAKNAEISLVGQNLLDPHREEYGSYFFATVPSETPRGFYIQLDYKF